MDFDKSQTRVVKIPFMKAKKRVFNTRPEDLAIGQQVVYWEVMGEDGPKCEPCITTVASTAWEASGSTLVKLDGKRGGFDIGHIQLIPKQEAQ